MFIRSLILSAMAFGAIFGFVPKASADYIPFNVDVTMPGATADGFFTASLAALTIAR